MMMMGKKVKSAIAGFGAGFINGILGTGGGMVIAPLLIRWVRIPEKQALATTVMIIAPLCLLSATVYGFSGGLDWRSALPYLMGGLLGGSAAGLIFSKTSPQWLRRGFGALLIYGGIRMFISC